MDLAPVAATKRWRCLHSGGDRNRLRLQQAIHPRAQRVHTVDRWRSPQVERSARADEAGGNRKAARVRAERLIPNLPIAQTGATFLSLNQIYCFYMRTLCCRTRSSVHDQWRAVIQTGRDRGRRPQCRTGDLSHLFVLMPALGMPRRFRTKARNRSPASRSATFLLKNTPVQIWN